MSRIEQTQTHAKAFTSTLWDAVVVGGGMVGAATALALGQKGFRVLLLERAPVDTQWDPQMPFQTRVSALNRASENILKNLGVWEGVRRRRCHAFTDMHVWDEVTPGEVHFSAADMDEPNLGHIVENSVVQAAIWEQIELCEQIEVLLEEDIEAFGFENDQAWLILSGQGRVLTQLVIGADGAHSKVRQLAHIGLDTHDYEQCAVVGCVKTEYSHQNTCWQRYQKTGPFAFLAMSDNVSSIAWYLPVEKMQWALSLTDAEFAAAITEASGQKLGRVTEVAERSAFPLIRRHAEHYVKSGLALVGDAAHTIHPQAGQGANLGLLDAAALVEVLVNARQQRRSLGAYTVLRRYERWRRGDNAIVQRSMEGFDWLFRQDAFLKVKLRQGLLPFANRLTPVKSWLMDQALHGREALPVLAKRAGLDG
jgi:2-octaprenylphenol hydroxylase